jgi:hypothetical protein
MPLFVYPKDLRKGDHIVIHAEGQAWREEVDSISVNEDDPENKKVLVFTKSRMVACDPGMKVQISVQRGPEPGTEAEQSVGE